MLEFVLLFLFAIGLLICLLSGLSVFIALGVGYIYFIGYALFKGYKTGQIVGFVLQGVKVVKNVLINLILIGCITAAWRASGSIGYMINLGIGCILPQIVLPGIFILCSIMSFLMGSAFGSSASAGVVCMALAYGMGVNPVLAGGAIISGCYFGDRCSPVSTAMLLTSDLTRTKVHENIKIFLKSVAVPFILTVVVLTTLGVCLPQTSYKQGLDYQLILSQNYNLTIWTVLPVAAIIILALKKVSTKGILLVSTLLAVLVACIWQHFDVVQIPGLLIMGFHTDVSQFETIMGGGGVISMLKAFGILLVSSGYSGLFSNTGFLKGLNGLIDGVSGRIGITATMTLVATLVSTISCNQSLAIILTHDLCEKQNKDATRFAVLLANTAVLIPALIPWNTASLVPVMNIDAPMKCILAEFFIILVPVWTIIHYQLFTKNAEDN